MILNETGRDKICLFSIFSLQRFEVLKSSTFEEEISDSNYSIRAQCKLQKYSPTKTDVELCCGP
jgi:hypothetical protein